MKRNFINQYTVSALAVVFVAVAAVTVYTTKHSTAEAVSPQTTSNLAQKSPGQPQFSFDSSKAVGWTQGPTDKVSMAAFNEPGGCFVSVEHKQGKVDAASELRKKQGMLTNSGYTSTQDSTLTLTLQTSAGPEQYQLSQFSATDAPGGQKIKGGQEFGFIQLSNGYVKVEGWCDEPSQLASTLPALAAISFKQSK